MFSTIFSLSTCTVFTAAILHIHFDSAILGLYLLYFVIPIRKSGLVCTSESEIRDFCWQYFFNFFLSKNRTMGAKCNKLIVHLVADQQALMLVCFQASLAIFITIFFQISLTFSCILKIFFPFSLSSFSSSYLTRTFRQCNPRPVSILFCNPYQEVRACVYF